MFDKKGMKHVLDRHHPDHWDGSVKKEQSFLNKDLSISDIQNIAGDVIRQNRDMIISKGTKEFEIQSWMSIFLLPLKLLNGELRLNKPKKE
ncbi:hypothetical protein [Bacillus sp. S10(2024)]|uniref:hypothetical protein n=1 Tax=Bacillus sp. S10(2024) TaxID=3162886 RepID=UPI003D1ED0BB